MPRPRIAYLTSQYPRATDTFVQNEIACLRGQGFDVHTFSVRRPPADQLVSEQGRSEAAATGYLLDPRHPERLLLPAARELADPLRWARAARLALRCGGRGVAARTRQGAYLLEACTLARQLRERGVEHLHNHIGANSAAVAMLASQLSGIPYSLTIHGPSEFWAPEAIALGEKIARASFTACISEFGRSQCMLFSPPDAWPRIRLVRCGLTREFLEPEPPPFPDGFRMVNVGRLSAVKGHRVLLEAAARLADEGASFQITLVGDGELRSVLEAEIVERGLGDCVRLAGWADSKCVREEIARAHVLLVPSFAEGLPVVIMEAFALGRPAIATQIAGIPELVRPGESGWLIAPGSADALAGAVRQAMELPRERLQAMGRAGRERVLVQHDGAAEALKLGALFRASLARAREEVRGPR